MKVCFEWKTRNRRRSAKKTAASRRTKPYSQRSSVQPTQHTSQRQDIDALKAVACERMGASTAWRSAWNLSLEDEDPIESKAPWVRSLKLEEYYTLDHHREKADEVAKLYQKVGLGHYRDRVKNCTFYERDA